MNLAVCPVDQTPLTVLDRRRGDDRGPLLTCPACHLAYELGDDGPRQVTPTA